jgi:hypothetical protein
MTAFENLKSAEDALDTIGTAVEKAGGKVNWVQAKGVEEFKSIIDNLYKDHNNPNLLRRSRMMAEIPLHAFERFNSAAENAIRLTAFKSLVDRGYSHQQAASVARELTVNFNRRGQAGPVLNSLYLFYNASVQGNVRLFQSLAKSNTTKALVGTFVTLGIMVLGSLVVIAANIAVDLVYMWLDPRIEIR